MRYALAFIIGFILMVLSGPLPAAQRITFSPGGRIDQFYEQYTQWRLSGELVVIDGFCISACTFAVGLIEPHRLCATPYARLAFHSAHFVDQNGQRRFTREGTRLAWHIYPQNVRDLLIRRGWQHAMDHEELIYVEGAELHTIIRPCDVLDYAELQNEKLPGPKQ
jgi:hypothetical protein